LTETEVTLVEKFSLELAEIEADAREYQRERDILNERTSLLAKERNELNNQASALFKEIRQLRNQDREISSEISALRYEKEASFDQPLQEKIDKMKEDRSIPYHSLRREQRDLEWRLQTSVLKMDEERSIVERIAELQRQLKPAEERENIRQEIIKRRKHARTLRARIDYTKSRIPELVPQSRSLREQINTIAEKANEIRKAADEKHAAFLESKEQADAMHQKFIEKLKQVKACREQLSGVKGNLRRNRSEATKRKLDKTAESAYDKWKAGEKLTMDEFKLLVQKGLL
jgi:uncharacterized coiled-coil DUF342 family protein